MYNNATNSNNQKHGKAKALSIGNAMQINPPQPGSSRGGH